MRWGDLTELDFKLGNEDYVPRISLFEVMDSWVDIWEGIVGRQRYGDDPILIPASAGRLVWEPDEHKAIRPKPLSLAAYYAIFRKRGGYGRIPIAQCARLHC